MFGIFNGILRTATRTEHWNPPEYWQSESHMSAYDRQRISAERHRERLARDVGMR